MEPIHVVRDRGGLGDMVCVTAVVDALDALHWPRAVWVHGPEAYRELFENHCRAFPVTIYGGCEYHSIDAWPYRAPNQPLCSGWGKHGAIDLNCPAKRHEIETHGRPTMNRVQLFARAARVEPRVPRLCNLPDVERTNLITVFPRSAGSIRSLSGAVLEEIAWRLSPYGRVRICADTGGWTLHSLLSVCRESRLVVSVDTGPFHVANAVGTPTLGLFSSTDGRMVSSIYPETARHVQSPRVEGLDCPCYGLPERGFGQPGCALPECQSMCNLNVGVVVDKAAAILGVLRMREKRCGSRS